jgi:hypothetical protein
LLPDYETILRIARECFLREGCYPISFSWPRKFSEPQSIKSNVVSSTIPYVPYSFSEEDDYYQLYASSMLAITQKKGGWDCFRHLEIIGAGSVPLFLDANRIPKYTMIHYPKDLFKVVEKIYMKRALLPTHNLTISLIEYANRNLTSQAMCRYFAELSEFSIASRDNILFVDSKLASEPDYLSMFNFIGLKQVFGDQVICLFDEPDYVYEDTLEDVSQFYGRGFGYTRILNRSHKPYILPNSPKVLVLSNLERDFGLLESLKAQYPTTKFVLFWGADRPIPNNIKEEALRLTQGILFCREIY